MVRFKNRYLLLEINWRDTRGAGTADLEKLKAAFRTSLADNFGDYAAGLALSSFQAKYYNPLTQLCVIRCRREQHKEIWGAISLITSINFRAVDIRMIHTSGLLQACQNTAIQYNLLKLKEMKLAPEQVEQLAAAAEDRIKAIEW